MNKVLLFSLILIFIASSTLFGQEAQADDKIVVYSLYGLMSNESIKTPLDLMLASDSLLVKITSYDYTVRKEILQDLAHLRQADSVSIMDIDISVLCLISNKNSIDTLCFGSGIYVYYNSKVYMMTQKFFDTMSWLLPYGHYLLYDDRRYINQK